MGKDSPAQPTPIDPVATANAQANANITAAQATAALNRVNQTTPTGQVKWTQAPDGTWSQSTSFAPQQQDLYNKATTGAGIALAQLPNVGALQYGTSAPQLQTSLYGGGAEPSIQSSLPNSGQINGSVANAGPINGTVANAGSLTRGVSQAPIQNNLDLSNIQGIPQADNAAYQGAVNSVYNQAASRLDPQWQQQQTALETKLANQGVTQNSDAWNKAMQSFTQGKNDAYTSALNNAITQGSGLESTLFNMGLAANQAGVGNALTAGNFANSAQAQRFGQGLSNANLNNSAQQQQYGQNLSDTTTALAAQAQQYGQNLSDTNTANAAQQQQYQQNLGSGTFANSAAAQQLAQALSVSGFGNSALQQQFQNAQTNAGLNNAAVGQDTSRLIQQAGLPNQFSSIALPGVSGASVAAPDVLGANSLSAQQQMANYQNQTAQNSAKKGGTGSLLGTLGSAAILSDARMKRDIEIIGETSNGLPVYSFRYVWDDKRHTGLMAQDVEKIAPHAVVTLGGIKHVDYGQALAA
jgi:hypothetical protein